MSYHYITGGRRNSNLIKSSDNIMIAWLHMHMHKNLMRNIKKSIPFKTKWGRWNYRCIEWLSFWPQVWSSCGKEDISSLLPSVLLHIQCNLLDGLFGHGQYSHSWVVKGRWCIALKGKLHVLIEINCKGMKISKTSLKGIWHAIC